MSRFAHLKQAPGFSLIAKINKLQEAEQEAVIVKSISAINVVNDGYFVPIDSRSLPIPIQSQLLASANQKIMDSPEKLQDYLRLYGELFKTEAELATWIKNNLQTPSSNSIIVDVNGYRVAIDRSAIGRSDTIYMEPFVQCDGYYIINIESMEYVMDIMPVISWQLFQAGYRNQYVHPSYENANQFWKLYDHNKDMEATAEYYKGLLEPDKEVLDEQDAEDIIWQ